MNRGIEIVHEFGRHAAVTTFDFHPGQSGRPDPRGVPHRGGVPRRAGIPATGGAIGVYRMGPGGMTASVGFEVDQEIPGDGTVEPLTIAAGDTLRTLHVGPYERLPETYDALRSFAARHDLRLDEHVMWEEYRSHPEVEPAAHRDRRALAVHAGAEPRGPGDLVGGRRRKTPPSRNGSGAVVRWVTFSEVTRGSLGDLGDPAGADGAATLTDREAQALVHGDGLDQLDRPSPCCRPA